MEANVIENEHEIQLNRRRSCKMTGVCDVAAFDEHIVIIKTEMGELEIRGENLHIKNLMLEHGILEMEGIVNSMEYQDSGMQKQGESFWKRLMR